MLAFFDSAPQLIIVAVVVLILFGPDKLPEIGQQLGRALRELRRTTQDFTNAIHMDDHHETPYEPPRYDYGSYSSPTNTIPAYPSSSDDAWRSSPSETSAPAASEPPHGDFAAAALADPMDTAGGSPAEAATTGASSETRKG